MSANIKKVLLVGHCQADSRSLTTLVKKTMGITPVRVNNDAELAEHKLGPDTLLLVNRVPVGEFSAGGGIEIIAHFAHADNHPPMMLISNYPEAQAKAVALGALHGFGKSELRNQDVIARLTALSGSTPAAV